MRRLTMLLVVLVALAGGLAVTAQPAECFRCEGWCTEQGQCGDGCICVFTPRTHPGGFCVEAPEESERR